MPVEPGRSASPRRTLVVLLTLVGLAGVAALAAVIVAVVLAGRPTRSPSVSPSVSMTRTRMLNASGSNGTATAGWLVFASSPPSAVEVDGREIGTTPIVTSVAAGQHRVVLRPQGLGQAFERIVVLAPGGRMEVHGDFNDEPEITMRRMPSPL